MLRSTALTNPNRLIAALSPRDRRRLESALQPREVAIKELLHEVGEPIEQASFPSSGVISLVVQTEERMGIEIATIGNEGLLGTPLLLGVDHYEATVMCQVPGALQRMPKETFLEIIDEAPEIRELLYRYLQSLLNFVAQCAVCNRAHPIEQRCARWLLLTHDRVENDDFELTQEFLSQMLGVRRASVTVVANMLQKAGLISYSRGHIVVRDRPGLEKMSCDCYRFIRENYEGLVTDQQPGLQRARRRRA